MVNAKVFGSTEVNVRADYAGSRSARAGDDFGRKLDRSMKASDERLSKQDSQEIQMAGTDNGRASVSEKVEKLKKMFDKKEIGSQEKPLEGSMQEALEAVGSFNIRLVKELSEQFGIPAEEVTEAIDSLGFDEFDLLQTGNILKVIARISGNEDVTALLLDSDLSSMVKEMKAGAEAVTSMLDRSGLTKEALMAFKNAADQMSKQVEPEKEKQPDNALSVAQTEGLAVDDSDQKAVRQHFAQSEEQSGNEQKKGEQTGTTIPAQTSEMAGMNQELLQSIGEIIDEKTEVGGSGLSERIFNQILEGISANAGPETTSIELQLNPESLGRVSITVSTKDGVLTAQIAAQNQIAKEAIESQIAALKESFEEQGLKVEEVEITLASRQFDQNLDKERGQEQQNHSKRGRRLSTAQLEELTGIKTPQPEEDVAGQMHKEEGNTVSITA